MHHDLHCHTCRASRLRACRRGANISGVGGSWRRSIAQLGKLWWMCVPTVMLAISIISSTIMFVSRSSYIFTSSALFVSVSSLREILTSGDARLSAPASYLHTPRHNSLVQA